jgi:DegV family protein with EDD domain
MNTSLKLINIIKYFLLRRSDFVKVQLVTDSSSDLPKDLIDKYQIEVVPLTIIIDGQTYLDGVEINTDTFYQKLSVAKEIPKTSQPTPHAFLEAFKRANKRGPVLCITLSSGLSGTYQSAMLAKEMADFPVEVIDSLNISLGIGLQVLKACRMAEKGFTIQQIKEEILDYRAKMKAYFTLNTLEYAIKGGRVKPWEGGMAQLLNIKPVMTTLPDGTLGNSEKVRGRKKAINRLLEMVEAANVDSSQISIGIVYNFNEEEAAFFKNEIIKRINPHELIVSKLGPVFGSHGGLGVLGLAL